jgi:DNA polymerase-3 subunit beta
MGRNCGLLPPTGIALAFAAVVYEAELPRQEMILPRKTVLELNRLLVDTDDAMNVTSRPISSFAFGQNLLVSKLIAGKFPDYEAASCGQSEQSYEAWAADADAGLAARADSDNEKFRGRACRAGRRTVQLIDRQRRAGRAQEESESVRRRSHRCRFQCRLTADVGTTSGR